MNHPKVKSCLISLPITNKEDEIQKSNDLANVSVHNNKILDAIMYEFVNLHNSPIIWVHDFPYKLKLISFTKSHIELWQISLKIFYKTSGKEYYKMISKRRVKIFFH